MGNRNHGKFSYMSTMDPGHLCEGIPLNGAHKWLLKYKKFMKSCAPHGYTLEQYIDQINSRLDKFNLESVVEVDNHISRIFEGVFPYMYVELDII